MTSKSTEWRKANPEKAREQYLRGRVRAKDYREENKERLQAQTLAWKRANPEKVYIIERRRRLKKLYGLTIEEYDELCSDQNNKCAVCQKEEKLVVDHDHATGKIRGLLCNSCNRGLGLLRDDIQVLEAGLKYLKREKVA